MLVTVGISAGVGASSGESRPEAFPIRVLVPPGVGDTIAHVAAATAGLMMGGVRLVVLHDKRRMMLGNRLGRLRLFRRHVYFAHDLI